MIRPNDVVSVPTKAGPRIRAIVLRVYTHAGEYLVDVAREDDSRVGTYRTRQVEPCCNATGCLASTDTGWDGLCAHHALEEELLQEDVAHYVAAEQRGETPEAYERRIRDRRAGR